jgi:hypothetical protein
MQSCSNSYDGLQDRINANIAPIEKEIKYCDSLITVLSKDTTMPEENRSRKLRKISDYEHNLIETEYKVIFATK